VSIEQFHRKRISNEDSCEAKTSSMTTNGRVYEAKTSSMTTKYGRIYGEGRNPEEAPRASENGQSLEETLGQGGRRTREENDDTSRHFRTNAARTRGEHDWSTRELNPANPCTWRRGRALGFTRSPTAFAI
jgi:hypothetical protein